MAERGRYLAFALLLAAGCVNAARGPDPLVGPPPVGAAPHADAKPPTPAVFTAFGAKAARLDVRPADGIQRTRAEHVLIASVLDAEGRPLGGRRVEWKLDD